MRLVLEPVDVALFRDPRPFAAAEFARAETVGIVPPQTAIYGTLRHMLLERWNITYERYRAGKVPKAVEQVLGPREGFGTLSVNGPWLELQGERGVAILFAWPADAVHVKGDTFDTSGFLAPGKAWEEANARGMKALVPYRLENGEWRKCEGATEIKAGEGGLLHGSKIEEYLTGKAHGRWSEEGLIGKETHVGIMRNERTFRPEEGMLFSVNYLRLRDGGGKAPDKRARIVYGVEVDEGGGAFAYLRSKQARVGLGGERRPFQVGFGGTGEVVSAKTRRAVKRVLLESARDGCVEFRLLMVTRAAFRQGWKPDFFADGARVDGRVTYELRAAAVGRPVMLGSWDLTKRGRAGARAVLRYAPEGSVYFVRAQGEGMSEEEIVDKLLKKFWWKKSLCENPDRARLGQGLTLVGGMRNA